MTDDDICESLAELKRAAWKREDGTDEKLWYYYVDALIETLAEEVIALRRKLREGVTE